MNEFVTFVQVGFQHITDLSATDHIVFLIALAAIYRVSDWRDMLWVITAFTIGHSVTLMLAVSGALRLPSALVEFLIPVTIVATCIENIVVRDKKTAPWRGQYRPVFAGVFGLVHGAGFASYLNNLFIDSIAVPLLGFNVGIELGQILVLAVTLAGLLIIDKALVALKGARATGWTPVRPRAVALSTIIMVVAAHWAVQRSPW